MAYRDTQEYNGGSSPRGPPLPVPDTGRCPKAGMCPKAAGDVDMTTPGIPALKLVYYVCLALSFLATTCRFLATVSTAEQGQPH